MTNKKSKRKRKKGLELIRLLCTCGKRVKVSLKFAGKTGTCPKCGRPVHIPSLKVIKQKMKDMKEQEEKINFDIPSLPSLKEIVLDSAEQEQKDKIEVYPSSTNSIGKTAEELIMPDKFNEEMLSYEKTIRLPGNEEIEEIEEIEESGISEERIEPIVEIEKEASVEEIEEINEFEDEIEEIEEIEELEDFEELEEVPEWSDSSQLKKEIEKVENEDLQKQEEENAYTTLNNEVEYEQALEAEIADSEIDKFGMPPENEMMPIQIGIDDNIPQAMLSEQESFTPNVYAQEVKEVEEIDLPEATEEIEAIDPQVIITEQTSEILEAIIVLEEEISESSDVNFDTITANKITGGEHVMQGQAALETMKFDEAFQYLSTAINTGEDISSAYYLRAFVHIKKKYWHFAIEDLEHAREFGYNEIAIETTLNYVNFQLAQHYKSIGAYSEALNYLERIISSNISIEKGKLYWTRAKFNMKHKIFDMALRDIEEAILNGYEKPEIFEERGKIYLSQGDYESSMHDFTMAINKGGKKASLYQARSEAYFRMNQLDYALQDIKKAQEFASEESILYDLEGIILSEQKKYTNANEAFEKSLGLDPDNHIHYFNRGLAYLKSEKYNKAIEDFSKFITHSPDDRIAYLKRAICYQEKPNPNLAQARADFKKVESLEKGTFYRLK